MTTYEAYLDARQAVTDLHTAGIRAKIEESLARYKPDIVAKYNGPERVPPNKWVHVHFYPVNDDQVQAIAEKARHLNWLGIHFDTGGCVGQRDWELDWSFKYTGQPDGEHEERMEQVEGLLGALMSGDQGEGPPAKLCEVCKRPLTNQDGDKRCVHCGGMNWS